MTEQNDTLVVAIHLDFLFEDWHNYGQLPLVRHMLTLPYFANPFSDAPACISLCSSPPSVVWLHTRQVNR